MFIGLLDLAGLCLKILTMSELYFLHLHSCLTTKIKLVLNDFKRE